MYVYAIASSASRAETMSKACPERLILSYFHPIAASHLHKAVLPAQHWSSDASARHISKPWSPAKQPLRPSLVVFPCGLPCEFPFAKTLLLSPLSCTTLSCTKDANGKTQFTPYIQ